MIRSAQMIMLLTIIFGISCNQTKTNDYGKQETKLSINPDYENGYNLLFKNGDLSKEDGSLYYAKIAMNTATISKEEIFKNCKLALEKITHKNLKRLEIKKLHRHVDNIIQGDYPDLLYSFSNKLKFWETSLNKVDNEFIKNKFEFDNDIDFEGFKFYFLINPIESRSSKETETQCEVKYDLFNCEISLYIKFSGKQNGKYARLVSFNSNVEFSVLDHVKLEKTE